MDATSLEVIPVVIFAHPLVGMPHIEP